MFLISLGNFVIMSYKAWSLSTFVAGIFQSSVRNGDDCMAKLKYTILLVPEKYRNWPCMPTELVYRSDDL